MFSNQIAEIPTLLLSSVFVSTVYLVKRKHHWIVSLGLILVFTKQHSLRLGSGFLYCNPLPGKTGLKLRSTAHLKEQLPSLRAL